MNVETFFQVKTSLLAYALYNNQKEYCQSNNIRITWKNISLNYTKKNRFLVGTHVLLVLNRSLYSRDK